MEDDKLGKITNPVDHTFWSHDGYSQREDGYFIAKPGSNYAD